jgi:hypothetical protein
MVSDPSAQHCNEQRNLGRKAERGKKIERKEMSNNKGTKEDEDK